MIIWEYLSLSVVSKKILREIKWVLIPDEERVYEPGQKIPYTPHPNMPLIHNMDDLLNDYGAHGWELINIVPIAQRPDLGIFSQNTQFRLIFKRPKQEEE